MELVELVNGWPAIGHAGWATSTVPLTDCPLYPMADVRQATPNALVALVRFSVPTCTVTLEPATGLPPLVTTTLTSNVLLPLGL